MMRRGGVSGYEVAQWVSVTVAALHACSLGSIFSTGKKENTNKTLKNSHQKIKLTQCTLLLAISKFSKFLLVRADLKGGYRVAQRLPSSSGS